MISSEDLIGQTDFGKIKVVQKIFNDAYNSPVSLIIVDNIERLLEYVHVGMRFNNNILQCFLTYLKKLPEKIGHKMIVLGTTSNKEILKELGVWECFNLKVEVPVLKGDGEIQEALSQLIPGLDASRSLPIEKNYKIPMQNLYFIANVINQKLSDNPNADVKQVFLDILTQTELD